MASTASTASNGTTYRSFGSTIATAGLQRVREIMGTSNCTHVPKTITLQVAKMATALDQSAALGLSFHGALLRDQGRGGHAQQRQEAGAAVQQGAARAGGRRRPVPARAPRAAAAGPGAHVHAEGEEDRQDLRAGAGPVAGQQGRAEARALPRPQDRRQQVGGGLRRRALRGHALPQHSQQQCDEEEGDHEAGHGVFCGRAEVDRSSGAEGSEDRPAA
ncbi:hypothetical protein ON010_g3685 [Phytophthora cinnamomi]|nr:hypothetical protein ON010_g3685 [Phytophthora cinnamomi]